MRATRQAPKRSRPTCKTAGVDAIAVQGDVANDADCRGLVQAALDRWKRLDVLINNAATTKPIPHKRMDLLDRTEFERVFAVNVIGNYQMCRAAAPHLKASGDAAIVNISSVGAFRAGGSSIAYVSSKGALNTMTISPWRGRWRPEVRVNTLCPGGMLGAWTRKILSEEQYQAAAGAGEDGVSAQARHLADRRGARGHVPGRGRDGDDRRADPHGLRPALGRDQRAQLVGGARSVELLPRN